MSRSLLAGLALVFTIAGQPVYAASIYSFSGQFDQVSSWPGVDLNQHAHRGLYNGAPVVVQILLDAERLGHILMEAGYVEIPGLRVNGDDLSTSEIWARHAELVQSNIPVGPIGTDQSNIYQDLIHSSAFMGTDYFYGSIGVGGMSISKKTYFPDASAFVENWRVGDELDLFLAYAGIFYEGTLTLTAISEPLPGIVPPSAVPVPAAAWLFGSGLLGLGAASRRRLRTN